MEFPVLFLLSLATTTLGIKKAQFNCGLVILVIYNYFYMIEWFYDYTFLPSVNKVLNNNSFTKQMAFERLSTFNF